MRKLYFIASLPVGATNNTITGVVANSTGRKANAEEVTALVTLLREKGATQSLQDALRDSTYPGPVSVFDRRAEARKEAALLNEHGGFFTWHIIELGESIRKPVRQVKGWRIKYYGTYTSCLNSVEDGATVRVDGDEENNRRDNLLFPTRAAARDTCIGDKRSKANPNGYYVEAVYVGA